MMYSEFLNIAGIDSRRVSYREYSEIYEPMYNALPDNMTKYDFIALLNFPPVRFEIGKTYRPEINADTPPATIVSRTEKRAVVVLGDYSNVQHNAVIDNDGGIEKLHLTGGCDGVPRYVFEMLYTFAADKLAE